MPTDLGSIARVCHEANRAWCVANDDNSQVPWDDAPDWQRLSALEGVKKALEGATPEQLHIAWCRYKTAHGWKYGEVKDVQAMTHPCLVPYAKLPEEQRRKDSIFHAIVGALA